MKFTPKKMNPHLRAALLLAFTFYAASAAPSGLPDFKRVSFDEFFAGEVVSIPLTLEIPAQYVRAKGLKVQPTYSYWMRPDEVASAAKTTNLPAKSGYIYGKLSLNEAFDR